MSRELGALIREHYAYFSGWDRIVIYYDNGQKEITNLVNSVFNAHLSNVEVRKVVPADYSLFQAAGPVLHADTAAGEDRHGLPVPVRA